MYTANVWDVFCHTRNSKGKFKSIVDEMELHVMCLFKTMFCCTSKDNSSGSGILGWRDLSSNP